MMKNMMKRLSNASAFLALLGLAWHLSAEKPGQAFGQSGSGSAAVSGNGKYKFRVLYNSSHLPAEARAEAVLKAAHGGFAIDRRPGKGEIYFALPGAGIVRISSDLKSTAMLATDPGMRDTNMHNALFWQAKDGAPFLSFPGNAVGKIFTTSLDGKLIHTLNAPPGFRDMGHPVATDYFTGRGNFIPTDVEVLDGLFYIPTGYSNLDFVLTARIESTSPFKADWHDLAFGGRGGGPGQFGTGHGITIPPGTARIEVSDRPNSEIDRFTRYGQYLSTLRMPQGSLPCDIAYSGRFAVVGSLDGPDRSKGAPIYLLENDKLVSTIMPKEDLGLENFKHVHNATIKEMDGKIYIVAQAWNPGDFAIFEQVVP
jgi:hypothetical protein